MVDEGPGLEVTQCPSWAAVLGYMGVASAVCLSNWGSAVRVWLIVIKLWLLLLSFQKLDFLNVRLSPATPASSLAGVARGILSPEQRYKSQKENDWLDRFGGWWEINDTHRESSEEGKKTVRHSISFFSIVLHFFVTFSLPFF